MRRGHTFYYHRSLSLSFSLASRAKIQEFVFAKVIRDHGSQIKFSSTRMLFYLIHPAKQCFRLLKGLRLKE